MTRKYRKRNTSTGATAKITFQYSPKPTPVLPMSEQIDVTDEHLTYNGKDWDYLDYTLKREKDGIIMAEPGVPMEFISDIRGVYVPPVAHGVGGFPRPPPPYSPMVASAVPVPKPPGNWWKTLRRGRSSIAKKATRKYSNQSTGGKRTRKRKSKKRHTRKHKKKRKSKKRKFRRRK